MGKPKITGFMIALVLVGFFCGIFSMFIADMNKNYGVAYDNTSLAVYDKLDEITEQTEEIQEATDIKEKTGILDIIGGYFSSAYNALRLTSKSFSLFNEMSEQAIEDSNLGAAGRYLKITIQTIVLIIIFIGIFLAAIIKWEL